MSSKANRSVTPASLSAADKDFVSTLVRGSLESVLHIVSKLDGEALKGSLARMSTDNTEVLICKNSSATPHWDTFAAGGPFGPEWCGVNVSRHVGHIRDRDSLADLLGALSHAPEVDVTPTKWPWHLWWRPSGLPRRLATSE